MDVIDQSLLHELVLFLNLFQIATKELEAFKTPTLHLVTHWQKVLLEHCDIVDEEHVVKDKDGVEVTLPPDSKDLENIKDLIKDHILEKFMLTALHAATTYLDPVRSRSSASWKSMTSFNARPSQSSSPRWSGTAPQPRPSTTSAPPWPPLATAIPVNGSALPSRSSFLAAASTISRATTMTMIRTILTALRTRRPWRS
jgi:hypothetical protein